MEINFNPVDNIYYGPDEIDEVYQKGQLIWPPKVAHAHAFTDSNSNNPVTIKVDSGDTFRLYSPAAPDIASWLDGGAAIFKLESGKLIPVQSMTHMPQGWSVDAAQLDGVKVPHVIHTLNRGALSTIFDTTGLKPGEYHILAGDFLNFESTRVQFIIKVTESGVPPVREIQLPDDPWSVATQTLEVYKGQTIVFKYPVNAKKVDQEPKVMGWRHLNFAYVDKGHTYEANFPQFTTGKVQVDAFGENAGYTMRFELFGTIPEQNAAAFNIGQYAAQQKDVVVTIRGDATAEFIYVVSYNGNFGEHYQDKGVLYKLHVKDYVKPSTVIVRTVESLPLQTAYEYFDFDNLGNDHGVYDMPEYTVSHLANISFKQPTDPSFGLAFDGRSAYIIDQVGHIIGHVSPSDDSGDGTFQVRYGGMWIFPNTVKAGDVVYLSIGQSYGAGYWAAKITFT